jgi:hypothetical protein
VGIGFRPEARGALEPRLAELDTVEIVVDDLISDPAQRDGALAVCRRMPPVAHGVGLSIGTAAAPDVRYLDQVARTLEEIGAPWYSEHLAFTKVPGRDVGQLLPLPRTPAAAEIVAENLAAVRRHVGVPVALENISYYFEYPESTLGEAEFIGLVLRESGCGLLLDLENLYLNATNHRYEARDFIDSLAPGLVKGVHVAGGVQRDGILVDTHDRPVPEPVFELLDYLLKRQAPDSIILERDQEFERLDEVFDDVTRLRQIVASNAP